MNITALANLLGSCLRVGVILLEYNGACKTYYPSDNNFSLLHWTGSAPLLS